MAHKKMVYRYGPGGDKYTEYEFKFVGRFGAKGEKRGPRKKATPEQIRKQNQWNKEKTVLRLIRENFGQERSVDHMQVPSGNQNVREGSQGDPESLSNRITQDIQKKRCSAEIHMPAGDRRKRRSSYAHGG
ncbi:MAG: hypothetical protein ACLR7N_13515 [Roseburia hominis]